MSIGSTSSSVEIEQGGNTAGVSDDSELQTTDSYLRQLVDLGEAHLRELRKISLMLSAMSGITLEDDELQIL